ncbi:unnamed protein product [Gadus morhua 'NCC']
MWDLSYLNCTSSYLVKWRVARALRYRPGSLRSDWLAGAAGRSGEQQLLFGGARVRRPRSLMCSGWNAVVLMSGGGCSISDVRTS